MAEAPQYDFDLEQGTSYREIIAIEDDEGNLTDLSGWQWQVHAKPIAAQAASDPVAFSFRVELLTEATDDYPANCAILISLEPEDTRDLEIGDRANDEASQFRYDIDGIDSLGDKHRARKGVISMHRDIRPLDEVP